MLAVAPSPVRYEPRDWDTAMHIVRAASRWAFDWPQFLIGWAAGFHLAAGIALLVAPDALIVTPSSAPIFDMASRYVWGAVFLVGSAAITYVLAPRPRYVQHAVWLVMLFVGGMWLTTFGLAVVRGEGSLLWLFGWLFLYGPWAVVAIRRSLGKR